jgi:DNA topoisomerase-1
MSGLTLVIVESPGKISKIGHILGDSYIVDASVGHIMDLDKKTMSINLETFEPMYKIIDGKESIVSKLKAKFKKCKECLIATDEDREGEMIAWSLAKELGIKNPKRIIFNSITKKELLEAVKNPKKIDQDMVDAQKLRRLLDRIIGYRLSPLLWKNIGAGKSSAGRVQSVVVKLIIEKEMEINNFFEQDTSSEFKTSGFFSHKKNIFKSNLYTTKKIKDKKSESEDESDSNGSDSNGSDSNGSDSSGSDSSGSDSSGSDSSGSDSSGSDSSGSDSSGSDELEEGKIKKGILSKINKYDNAYDIMKIISKSKFKISGISKREAIQNPSPPFTTSTLQQEASRKLGFTTKRTMMAAQHLYEGGYITYMRTDSTNLSEEAIKIIGDYVIDKYGKKYYKQTNYTSKAKNTQEAHEAIRPTDPNKTEVSPDIKYKIGNDEAKLYTLIWKRSVASQMSPAKFKVIKIQIGINKLEDYYFESEIRNIIFKGFLAVYDLINVEEDDNKTDDEKIEDCEIIIPKIGTELKADSITTIQDYKKPPIRYNEASLINKLDPKNLNIGRPSTYATIINKIQDARYVIKDDVEGLEKESKIIEWKNDKMKENVKKINLGKEKNKFIPTEIGIIINKFLDSNFPEIMNYKFTADMENKLDKVALGKLKWDKVLKEFYDKFQPFVDKLNETSTKSNFIDENLIELGIHPVSGFKIVATIAKFGPVVKILGEGKPIIAPIKKPLTLKKIKLEDALKIFEYPKPLGKINKKDVMLYKGQYGFYLKVDNKDTYALKIEEEDIDDFKLEDAKKIMEIKDNSNLWNGVDDKNKYIILDGEFGKYIKILPLKGKSKGTNCKLPLNEDTKKITIERIYEIIKENKIKPKYVKKDN